MTTDEEAIRIEVERRLNRTAQEIDFEARLDRRESNASVARAIAEGATDAAVEKALEVAKDKFHVDDMERRLKDIEGHQVTILKEQARMKKLSNIGTGGLAVLLAIGAFIMWFASLGEHVKAIFTH